MRQRAIQILWDEWERWEEQPTPKDYPTSQPVYDRLRAEGHAVPDYALRELWEQLQAFGLIRVALFQGDRERWRTDGLAEFRAVDPDVLDYA